MDKFLIASNPMVGSRDIYIVHALRPVFLIRAMNAGDKTMFSELTKDGEDAISLSIRAPAPAFKSELWVLIPVLSGTDIEPGTREAQRVLKITERAARWFRAYREQNYAGHHVEP